jgi:predicted nucleotidyltransferase
MRSDIDLRVELISRISLFRFIELKLEIEEALGRNVDLVEHGALKPFLRDQILADLLPILDDAA